MYVIKSNRKTNSYTVRKINRVTQVVRVGKRGIQGEPGATGPQGPKGDKGDKGDTGTTDYNELQNLPDLTLKADKSDTYTKTEVDTKDTTVATTAQNNLTAHTSNTNNPHSVTKAQVGLSNVPNTDFTADVTANTAARHTHSNKATLDATTASFTTAQENKLAGIATGATANATDAQLRDRSTHTGTQAISTVANLQSSLDNKADLVDGKVPESQLPSYVDDVLTCNTAADFPATGEDGKIYIAKDTNLTYRWTGSAYAEISPSLALGETPSTAYRGDRGKTAYDHTLLTNNPHSVTKAQVGLGNVDNTSDADKPVSTATQTALNAKQDTLVSGTNIKTINGDSVLGSGNLTITGGGGGGAAGSVQFVVARSGGSTDIAANGFRTYPLDGVPSVNVGGGTWDPATYRYTIPSAGLYLCLGMVRLHDGQPSRSLAVGIGTALSDGPHVHWADTGGGPRAGRQYTRLTRFNAGNQVFLMIYSGGAVFTTMISGQGQSLSITKIAD